MERDVQVMKQMEHGQLLFHTGIYLVYQHAIQQKPAIGVRHIHNIVLTQEQPENTVGVA